MSDSKPSDIIRFPGTECSDAEMLNELDLSITRIDADLARVMTLVEPDHYSNDHIRERMKIIFELSDLRFNQVLRREGAEDER
jgi:hypothetical protein